jgi:hypothetical protein
MDFVGSISKCRDRRVRTLLYLALDKEMLQDVIKRKL